MDYKSLCARLIEVCRDQKRRADFYYDESLSLESINPENKMTQEEHWKKAYRDKCKEMSTYQNATFNKLKKYFEEKKGKEDELVARIHQKYNDAELLISELERVLFFTHDDIRSSLAKDTVSQIEGALDKIRIYQGLKPKFKQT